jgi:choloylglycine hydrolase
VVSFIKKFMSRAAFALPLAIAWSLALSSTASACSSFTLDNEHRLSGRTMDVGDSITAWGLETVPLGDGPIPAAEYGYVRFYDRSGRDANLTEAGLNTAGLSCDMLHLNNSTYPSASGTAADVWVGFFCDFALARFNSSSAFAEFVSAGRVVFHGGGAPKADDQHFVVRDALGLSVVVEFEGGAAKVYADAADGELGFGVVTNEPPFPWQVANARHMLWKRSLARPAVGLPGAYYPDERFLRLVETKAALRPPPSYRAAVMQVVFVLNTVTVPPGEQYGTDTPLSAAQQGRYGHTNFGVVYDHAKTAIYWRSEFNMNLQRLRLSDAELGHGAERKRLSLGDALPWYEDAAHALSH